MSVDDFRSAMAVSVQRNRQLSQVKTTVRFHQAKTGREEPPTITVDVPVLQEEDNIGGVIERLRGMSAPGPVEVVVVDGDPGGSTLAVLDEDDVVGFTAKGGRAGQMNAGAERAGGETLMFLHADTVLPEAAFFKADELLSGGEYAGGAFELDIDSDHFWIRATVFMANRRNRISRVPFGDQALFFKRQTFLELGGFAPIPIMEDVEFMRRLKRRGLRIGFIEDRVMTSARRWRKEGIFYTTLRNWTLQALFAFGVPAEALAKRYRPHRDKPAHE